MRALRLQRQKVMPAVSARGRLLANHSASKVAEGYQKTGEVGPRLIFVSGSDALLDEFSLDGGKIEVSVSPRRIDRAVAGAPLPGHGAAGHVRVAWAMRSPPMARPVTSRLLTRRGVARNGICIAPGGRRIGRYRVVGMDADRVIETRFVAMVSVRLYAASILRRARSIVMPKLRSRACQPVAAHCLDCQHRLSASSTRSASCCRVGPSHPARWTRFISVRSPCHAPRPGCGQWY